MPLKPFWCIFLSQNKQNVKFLPEIVIFSGTIYHRDSKPAPLDLVHLKPYIHATQAISMHFPRQNQQNVKFLPEIVIFQEPFIIETQNLCHWIWHASNPTYIPLQPFWCIFCSQNQQNVKFLPEIVICQEQLIIETQNPCHWIQHALNTTYGPLNPFWCIFPSQKSTKYEIFCYLLNSPNKKWKKKHQFEQGKVFEKPWKSAHVGFWVCQLQSTMLELCTTSAFWIMMVSLIFDRKVWA